MIKKIISDISKFLPLVVDYIEWDDPTLSFGGNRWGLSTISCWRVIKSNKLDFGCDDDIANEEVKKFLSDSVVSIEIQSEYLPSDPVFIFSKGHRLEIFSVMYLEPWVFGSPTGVVHVGSPSDDRYM